MCESSTQKMHHAVNQKDETDMSNQVLQDELDRRRDENRRLEMQVNEEQAANVSIAQQTDFAASAR